MRILTDQEAGTRSITKCLKIKDPEFWVDFCSALQFKRGSGLDTLMMEGKHRFQLRFFSL